MLILAVGCFAINANAQKMNDADVPVTIKNSFAKMYPTAKVQKWEKEGNNFEAEFDNAKVETSVLIGPNGQLMETEVEIKPTDLPKSVSDYVAKNLVGKKIKEASKITDAKNVVTYEAEVDEADYIFDATGNFIKKNVENDGDKDKD